MALTAAKIQERFLKVANRVGVTVAKSMIYSLSSEYAVDETEEWSIMLNWWLEQQDRRGYYVSPPATNGVIQNTVLAGFISGREDFERVREGCRKEGLHLSYSFCELGGGSSYFDYFVIATESWSTLRKIGRMVGIL